MCSSDLQRNSLPLGLQDQLFDAVDQVVGQQPRRLAGGGEGIGHSGETIEGEAAVGDPSHITKGIPLGDRPDSGGQGQLHRRPGKPLTKERPCPTSLGLAGQGTQRFNRSDRLA